MAPGPGARSLCLYLCFSGDRPPRSSVHPLSRASSLRAGQAWPRLHVPTALLNGGLDRILKSVLNHTFSGTSWTLIYLLLLPNRGGLAWPLPAPCHSLAQHGDI